VASFGTFDTQRLTSADIHLVPDRIRRRWLLWLLSLAVLMAAGLVIFRGPLPLAVGAQLIDAHQKNEAMRAELEHVRLELQMERATRTELQRQIQTLGDEAARLHQQLEFVNSRSGK
jgi:septal ring factor EnvC (AmiA/AmiB activator)